MPEAASFAEAGIDAHLAERRCRGSRSARRPLPSKGRPAFVKGILVLDEMDPGIRRDEEREAARRRVAPHPNPVVAASFVRLRMREQDPLKCWRSSEWVPTFARMANRHRSPARESPTAHREAETAKAHRG